MDIAYNVHEFIYCTIRRHVHMHKCKKKKKKKREKKQNDNNSTLLCFLSLSLQVDCSGRISFILLRKINGCVRNSTQYVTIYYYAQHVGIHIVLRT